MKKVRIMLAAVLALAIVGGSLAFKAKSGPLVCAYTTENNAFPDQAQCTLTTFDNAVTVDPVHPNQYATVILVDDADGIEDCPTETQACPKAILDIEE